MFSCAYSYWPDAAPAEAALEVHRELIRIDRPRPHPWCDLDHRRGEDWHGARAQGLTVGLVDAHLVPIRQELVVVGEDGCRLIIHAVRHAVDVEAGAQVVRHEE